MKLTWYGTATIGLEDGETRLLFDPFVRMNRRMKTTPIEGFCGFDAVLVTHDHKLAARMDRVLELSGGRLAPIRLD